MAQFKGRQSANVKDKRSQGYVGFGLDAMGAGARRIGRDYVAPAWNYISENDPEAEARSNYEAMFGPGSWERHAADMARLSPPNMSDREVDRSVYREPGYQPNYRSASEVLARDFSNMRYDLDQRVADGVTTREQADKIIDHQWDNLKNQIQVDLDNGVIDPERAGGIVQRVQTGGPFDPSIPAGTFDNPFPSAPTQGAAGFAALPQDLPDVAPSSQWPVDPNSALQQGAPASPVPLPNSQNYGEDNDYLFGDEANPTRRNGVQGISADAREIDRSLQEIPQETIGTYSPPDMAGAFAGGEKLSPAVVQTIIAESLGEGPEGMRLVAETIMNRARERGITPEQVVMEKGQYAPHSPQYAAGSAINLNDPDNIAAATAAWGAAQSAEDPTMGAEFFNVTGTKAPTATERLQPVWQHGKHTFWNDTSGVKVMQQNLAAAGLYNGEIDGDFGPATKAAANAFRAQLGTDDPMQALTSLGVEPVVGQEAIRDIIRDVPTDPTMNLAGVSAAQQSAPASPEQAAPPPVAATGVTVPSPFSPPVSNMEEIQRLAAQQTVTPPTGAVAGGDYNDILDNGTAAPQQPGQDDRYISPFGKYYDAFEAERAGMRTAQPAPPQPGDRSDLTQAGPRYDPLNPASAATPPPMAGDPYADFETTRANVRSPETLRDMMGQAGLDDSQWDAGALGIPSQAIPPSTHPALMQQQYEQAARRDWARPAPPAAPPPQYDTRQEQIQEGQYRIGAPFNAEAEAVEAAGVRERLANANPERLLRDEREMASIARTQPIGPPESRNYRIGQGLRPDLQETVGIGGPDAPPSMATATQDFGAAPTPIVDVGLTAMPPNMSWSDLTSTGGLTPEQITGIMQLQANRPPSGGIAAPAPAPAPVTSTTGTYGETPASAATTTAQTVAATTGANISAADALDLARAIEGNSEIEPQGRALISEFLQTGGIGMDPKVTPWCAAMVNASLAQVGIEGTGSMAASSFAEWGDAVEPGDVQKGDVLYKMGTAAKVGDPGGHVGFATGNTRMENGVLQYEMYGGNQTTDTSGERGVTANVKWVDASEFNPRRAPIEAHQVAAATTAAATAATQTATIATPLQTMIEATEANGLHHLTIQGDTIVAYQDEAGTKPWTPEQQAQVAKTMEGVTGSPVSMQYGELRVAPESVADMTNQLAALEANPEAATTTTTVPVESAATPAVAPAEAPAAAAPAAAAAPVSTMRDVAMAAHNAGFRGRIDIDPVTHRISGFNHAVDPGFGKGKFPGGEPGGKFPNGQPWTPEQKVTIAAAVPGIVVDADGGLSLPPAAPAAAVPAGVTGTSDPAEAKPGSVVQPPDAAVPINQEAAAPPISDEPPNMVDDPKVMHLDLGSQPTEGAAGLPNTGPTAAPASLEAVGNALSPLPPNMVGGPEGAVGLPNTGPTAAAESLQGIADAFNQPSQLSASGLPETQPGAISAVPPPAAITGQEVAAVPGSEGRVQLTAPAGSTLYNTMEGPVVSSEPLGPENLGVLDAGPRTSPLPPVMSGKEKDDYLGPTQRMVTTVPISSDDVALPPRELAPDLGFTPQPPPMTGKEEDDYLGPAPAPAPVPVAPPEQLPKTQYVTPSVATPAVVAPPQQQAPVVAPQEKPSFEKGAEKYSGRSKTFSDPIEYAARNSVGEDGRFDHDKFWEQLGEVDLNQTQQAQASRTAAQGAFHVNKMPNFLSGLGLGGGDMPQMSNVVQPVQNAVSGIGNLFGGIFGGGQQPYSGGGPTGSGGYASPNYNTFAQQAPPGSSGNYGGSYNGPGSGSYGGGGMGGSQYGGGWGGGGGFGGAGTYGSAGGGANIGQGIGQAYRNR